MDLLQIYKPFRESNNLRLKLSMIYNIHMDKNALITQLESVCLYLSAMKGHRFRVEEFITRTASKSYNRHLCTRTTLFITLDNIGIAISGGRLFLDDVGPTTYELCVDYLSDVFQEDGKITFEEKFSEKIHRITEVSLYEPQNPMD